MFLRLDHMLGHKTSLNKLKRIGITISSLFSDHNNMKLEINIGRKMGPAENNNSNIIKQKFQSRKKNRSSRK